MPNYVQAAETALRAECARTGHTIDDTQARLYTLLLLVKGADTTLADVHDAWGVGRNQDRPEHPDLIPFDQLTPEVVDWDVPFQQAIIAVAEQLDTAAEAA